MTQFVTSVLSVNSALGIGLSITLTTATNPSTVSLTSYSIQFNYDRTSSPLMVACRASPPGPISLPFSMVVGTVGTIKGMMVVAC